MAIKLAAGRFLGSLQKAVATDTARYSETFYAAGTLQPAHTHELPHISLTVQGHYSEMMTGKERTIPRGSLTFYHPEEIHRENHASDGIHFLIEILPRKGSIIERMLPEFRRDPAVAGPALNLAWRLYNEFCSPDPFSPLAMESLVLEIVVDTFRGRNLGREKFMPVWMLRVMEILHDHFTDPFTLAAIAHKAGVHPVHLAKTFRAFYGMTVGEYTRRLRIDFAREKLAGTGEPLAQIALAAGFAIKLILRGSSSVIPE